MKRVLSILCLLIIMGCQSDKDPFDDIRIIDLTHPFDEQTIYWPTSDGFRLEKITEGETEKGYFYAANRFAAAEHGGTHIDAPIHFVRDKDRVDQIALERLIGPGIMIDISAKAQGQADYQISVEDIEEWEQVHGRIPDGAIVLLRTGYGAYWPDPKTYLGTAERGDEGVAKLRFPGLGPETARWLLEERNVGAIGIDVASIDYGQSQQFMAHRILSEENRPVFENLARLELLPARGFTVVALPMLIRGGTGAPLRIVALVPL